MHMSLRFWCSKHKFRRDVRNINTIVDNSDIRDIGELRDLDNLSSCTCTSKTLSVRDISKRMCFRLDIS